jgi:hypothetical protein
MTRRDQPLARPDDERTPALTDGSSTRVVLLSANTVAMSGRIRLWLVEHVAAVTAIVYAMNDVNSIHAETNPYDC